MAGFATLLGGGLAGLAGANAQGGALAAQNEVLNNTNEHPESAAKNGGLLNAFGTWVQNAYGDPVGSFKNWGNQLWGQFLSTSSPQTPQNPDDPSSGGGSNNTPHTGAAPVTPTMTSVDAGHEHEVRDALAGGVSDLQVDAGSFDISSEAKAELLDAFRAEMAKLGIPVSATGVPVTLRVTEFKTRPVAARILFGALSGSDHIKGTVNVARANFEVSDTAVSVVAGLGVVARDVGIQVADGIGHLAGVPRK
nr:hypothetical protein [Paraburkholderia caribensis]